MHQDSEKPWEKPHGKIVLAMILPSGFQIWSCAWSTSHLCGTWWTFFNSSLGQFCFSSVVLLAPFVAQAAQHNIIQQLSWTIYDIGELKASDSPIKKQGLSLWFCWLSRVLVIHNSLQDTRKVIWQRPRSHPRCWASSIFSVPFMMSPIVLRLTEDLLSQEQG